MKKIIFTIAIIFAGITIACAQTQTFEKGTSAINIGIGFGNTLYTGSFYNQTVLPISASFEYGIIDKVGVGGFIGYCASKWEDKWSGYTWGWKYSYLVIGVRGNYHFYTTDKLDAYGGLMLGYNIVSSKDYYDGPGSYEPYSSATGSQARITVYAGGRYYFTNNIGAFAELGWGWTIFNIGLSVKFP